MVLGDRIFIPTIVENLSKLPVHSVLINVEVNDKIKVWGNSTIHVDTIEPQQRQTVFWDIQVFKICF